jgi:hypothetical protein
MVRALRRRAAVGLQNRSLYAEEMADVIDPHAGTVVSERILWGNFVQDQPMKEDSGNF